ncbi:MAG: polyphosphate kinase 1 [Bacteroidales bacterium]|nr:polyphosphate kinase 1 [Bacteroidales bacterium]
MPKNKPRLINREISWLHFNQRVLQEAADPSVPLIERLKFLGIFSNNLDEFYRVRVATLNRMLRIKKKEIKYIDFNPSETLKQIVTIDKQQQKMFAATYDQLVRELVAENIFLINEKELSTAQVQYVLKYFREHVRSQLFPLMVANLDDPNRLKDKSIYLAIHLRHSQIQTDENFALVKVPTSALSRFVILPPEGDKKFIILLDDVIRVGLPDIFSIFGYDCFDAYTIKLTRDAELDIENDVSKSFLEVMSESLKQRKAGVPVRFIYDKKMPGKMLKMLLKKTNISENDTVSKSGRYHNFKDFMYFPDLGRPDLCHPPAPPLPHPDIPFGTSIFDIIRTKDIMLHYPYQSFNHIIDLLREASIDPNVRAIKMTLYRVARFSNVINALINAARNGKEVVVFLELQARFDEEANIYWSEKLLEEGVKVIRTIPGMKVHSKLLLIRRKENNQNMYYAAIGTGNFNEQTSRIYADDSLLTANPKITAEVNKVFYLFETKYRPVDFKQLVVAPFAMRNYFLRLLNKEMKNAEAGKEAWAIIKLNSLSDPQSIDQLYKASQAGVKLKLIIRGICMLVPGIPGISDNIEVISIVDKFLEHSRVLVFCNTGKPTYFISSADWMIRNFDNRIEVACPIYDADIQQELRTMLGIQWSDNVKARAMSNDDINKYRKTGSVVSIRAQDEIYGFFEAKSLS